MARGWYACVTPRPSTSDELPLSSELPGRRDRGAVLFANIAGHGGMAGLFSGIKDQAIMPRYTSTPAEMHWSSSRWRIVLRRRMQY